MKVALYLRVSTDKQTSENQRLELEKHCARMDWQISKMYVDEGISGKNTKRPALQQMLKDASTGKFETLVVWKIDRLARSVIDLLNILNSLTAYGVDFISTTQSIDTTNPMGKMVLTFLGAIAEFERETISERVKAGIERARAEGKTLGRPRVAIDVPRALELRAKGLGYKQVAKQLGVPRTTLYRTLSAIPLTAPAKS